MKLNQIEKWMMNNPIRSRMQRREAALLLEMGGPVEDGTVLEVGCGRGVGTELILDMFGASRVDALDFDPDMVRRAKKRLTSGRPRIARGSRKNSVDTTSTRMSRSWRATVRKGRLWSSPSSTAAVMRNEVRLSKCNGPTPNGFTMGLMM